MKAVVEKTLIEAWPTLRITRGMFLDDIDRFCADKKISRTEFGKQVFSDGSFYGRVQRGTSPTLDRVEHAYNFMLRAYEDEQYQTLINDLI